jgi:hypothetical protein
MGKSREAVAACSMGSTRERLQDAKMISRIRQASTEESQEEAAPLLGIQNNITSNPIGKDLLEAPWQCESKEPMPDRSRSIKKAGGSKEAEGDSRHGVEEWKKVGSIQLWERLMGAEQHQFKRSLNDLFNLRTESVHTQLESQVSHIEFSFYCLQIA